MRRWGFMTNHAMVLLHVVQHSRSTVREIALASDITERSTLSILGDLRAAGIVEGVREGRRNVYTVKFDILRHYRREGTAPTLLPDAFITELVKELLRLSTKDSPPTKQRQPDKIAYLRGSARGGDAPSSASIH